MNHYDETSDEFSGVVDLMKKFGDYFNTLPHVNGTIHLYNNIDLPGCGIRHDIDILMVGELENYSVDCSGENVEIKNFCTCIERKRSDASKINIEGTHLMVTYAGDPRPIDVTKQSNEQVNLYRSFCQARHVRTPFIVNLIWLAGITEQSLNGAWPEPHNAFASTYLVEHIFRKIASKRKYGESVFNSSPMPDFISEMDHLFASEKKFKPITWKVMNAFSDEKAKAAYDAYVNNDDLTVFAGRAGTGKTYTLLQIAVYLTKIQRKKCLFLTYNKALVSDVRYLLSHLWVYGDKITVQTKDSCFRSLLIDHNLWDDGRLVDFKNYIQNQLRILNDSNYVFHEEHYDYVFLDEAQDWTEIEQKVILKAFSKNRIVVADGIDQFIYGDERRSWGKYTKESNCSMRQKYNIASFVNEYAKLCSMENEWHVEPDSEFPGGHVYVSKSVKFDILNNTLEQMKQLGCEPYDLLLLAPDSMKKDGGFIFLEAFKKNRINVFDGLNDTLRDQGYPLDDDQKCRLYHYESCRGLEGWCTVCMRFDQMVEMKIKEFQKEGSGRLAAPKANLWSLMPLTRAVDTLYISVSDTNSQQAKRLKMLADKFDYVTCDF